MARSVPTPETTPETAPPATPAPKPFVRPAQPRPLDYGSVAAAPQELTRRRPHPHEAPVTNLPKMDHPATKRLEAMKVAARESEARRLAATATRPPRQDRPYVKIGLRPTATGGFDLIVERYINGEMVEDKTRPGLSRASAREALAMHIAALFEAFNH